MHFGAEIFQALFMLHAEVLLFVDDHQAKVGELDRLRQKRMRADDDFNRAIRQRCLRLALLLCRHQTRKLAHAHGQSTETLRECAEMLAAEQCRRRNHRHLLATHRDQERRAQRHFGFAETHVAADQTIHRLTGAEIAHDIVDRRELIVRFFIRKASAEFVPQTFRRCDRFGRACRAHCRDAQQFLGHIAQALFRARFAALPGDTTQLVELSLGIFSAIAADEFDVLDWQIELVTTGIGQVQTVVRCACDFERLQALVAADTVILVHNEIAGRHRRRFGDYRRRLAALTRPREAITENVLL